MKKEIKKRRINLRFDGTTFVALDMKRAEEGTSFQELGESWFLGWLSGQRPPPSKLRNLTAHEEAILCAVLLYLREKPYSKDKQMFIDALDGLAARYAGK